MIDAGSEGGDAAALIPVIAKKNVFAMALNYCNYQCATNSQTNCPNEWTLADPGLTDELGVAQWLKAHGIKKVGILEEEIDFTETETPTSSRTSRRRESATPPPRSRLRRLI